MKDPNEKCKCGNDACEPHPCPYREEIDDDSETLCDCCEECKGECAMDV